MDQPPGPALTWRDWLFPDIQLGQRSPESWPVVDSLMDSTKAGRSTKTHALNDLSLPLRLPARVLHLPDLASRMMTLLMDSPWMDNTIDSVGMTTLIADWRWLRTDLKGKKLIDENKTKDASDLYITNLRKAFSVLGDLTLELDKESATENGDVVADKCIFHSNPRRLWAVWEDKAYSVFEYYKRRVISLGERGETFDHKRGDDLKHEESIVAKVCLC
jgi:hypothetical protein